MRYEEFKNLTAASLEKISGEHLLNQEPRSLLFGRTDNRYQFHVYIDAEKQLHRVIYDLDGLLISHKSEAHGLTFEDCVPTLQAYPEKCDLEFCEHLLANSAFLPFTLYSWLATTTWYGKRLEELTTTVTASDVTADFTVDWSAYGFLMEQFSNPAKSRAWLTTTLSKQLTGYLRAITLRTDPDAELWFDNIRVLISTHIDINHLTCDSAAFEDIIEQVCFDAKKACNEQAELIRQKLNA